MVDFSVLLQQVLKLAAANASILAVAAALVSAYVVFKGSKVVLLLLRGGRAGVRTHYQNQRYEKRFKRGQERAHYRAWKKERMKLLKA